jgi:hypothetical protein
MEARKLVKRRRLAARSERARQVDDDPGKQRHAGRRRQVDRVARR